jgi:hypothetical protein
MQTKIKEIQTILLSKNWTQSFGYVFGTDDTLLFYKKHDDHFRITVTTSWLVMTKNGEVVGKLSLPIGEETEHHRQVILHDFIDERLDDKHAIEINNIMGQIAALKGPPKDTLLSIAATARVFLEERKMKQFFKLKAELETYLSARKRIGEIYHLMSKEEFYN